MLEHLRSSWAKVMTPPAKLLLRLGVTADQVTWFGTIVAVVICLVFFPIGWLWQGALLLTPFVIFDSLDGTMARLSGTSSSWGAFLDSTLDRITDGALFVGLIVYLARDGSAQWAGVAGCALVLAEVTSYTRARGGTVGVDVRGGISQRPDRLFISMLGALLAGFGLDWALPAAMIVLVVLGSVTVGQRIHLVHQALRDRA